MQSHLEQPVVLKRFQARRQKKILVLQEPTLRLAGSRILKEQLQSVQFQIVR